MAAQLSGLPTLYSEQEVAVYLGCSVRTLRDKRRREELSYVRVGGKVRYRVEDILEYLELAEVPARLPNAPTARRLSKTKSGSMRARRLRETKALLAEVDADGASRLRLKNLGQRAKRGEF